MSKRANIHDNMPIFLNISRDIRERLHKQCDRFGIAETMLIRMAITKWLEEEEKQVAEIEAAKKPKLIPKSRE